VAMRLLRRRSYAIIAAGTLALTPAHFIHSRVGMDYLYPVPFVLIWIWSLLKFDDSGDRRLLWAAGAALGLGFYSYIAAVGFMPLYLVFTWLFLLARSRRIERAHAVVTVAFLIPLSGFFAWRILYPQVFSGTADRYAITKQGVLLGALHLLNYNVIGDYVSSYWNFYNPNFLFLVGSPNFQSSTRAAGVFLLPLALFLAAGFRELIVRERRRVSALLIAGFLTAPIPAVLVEEPYAIYRELEILAFATLIAAFGVRALLNTERRLWRGIAAAALLLMPLQFGYFVRDYFTTYRLASYGWFGHNTPAAVAKVEQLTRPGGTRTIYLSPKIPYGLERWEFYLARDGRDDLFRRSRVLPADQPLTAMPSRSLFVVNVEDNEPQDPRVRSTRDVRRVADVVEPFGQRPVVFAVFERPE